MELDDNQIHKAHRKSKTGVKATKKKAKLQKDQDEKKERNPKVILHNLLTEVSGLHCRCQSQKRTAKKAR
jgi:hypothetical protein